MTGQLHETEPLSAVLSDKSAIAEMADRLTDRQILVTRRVMDPDVVRRLVSYLAGIGNGSLPNWRAIDPGCPNFHRLNWDDPRSAVRGAFHQFSFFPWNQDAFRLFDRLRDVFRLRNLLCGADVDAFLSGDRNDIAVARFSAQFYPCGGGYMNAHTDPVGAHQIAVPILAMSRFGADFAAGGLYVDSGDGAPLAVDPLLEPGDVIWFHPHLVHGVAPVDPSADLDWSAFRGRWSAILAVNTLPGAAGREGSEVASAGS